jgi:hypothetical protein
VESYFKLYLSSLQQDKVLNLKTSKSLVKRRKIEAEEVYRFLHFKLRTCEMDQDNFMWFGCDDFRYCDARDAVSVSSFERSADVVHYSTDVTLFFQDLVTKDSPEWYRFVWEIFRNIPYFPACKTHWPIRRTVTFSLGILEKNNDECILILVIYWKKTGLLHILWQESKPFTSSDARSHDFTISR